jgi:undecaprenyl-diphosphatase
MPVFITQLLELDRQFYLLVNHLPHPFWLNIFFLFIDFLSNSGVVWVLFCFGLIIFGGKKAKNLGIWGLLVVLVTTLFEGVLLKAVIFGRIRPFIALPGSNIYGILPDTFSFPSGQATNAFAVATFYSLIFRKRKLTTLFFSLAFLTALGRVYLGAHYPSDVTAGAIIGLYLGFLFYAFFQKSKPDQL